MTTGLLVTARLSTPVVGVAGRAVMLDGPLAWAAAHHMIAAGRKPAPITAQHAPDFDLPLDSWHMGDVWGWCTSAATGSIESWTSIQLRKKVDMQAMHRFTQDRGYHPGLGPHKARDTTIEAAWIPALTWHVSCTDQDRLERLLALVTHIGKHSAVGYGRVASWTVDTGQPDGWTERPLPTQAGARGRPRAPYWHASERVPMSSWRWPC